MSNNTNKRPYFSIIIATLNVERTLDKCLESIIQQTSINKIEILVKDGGSYDKTINILKAYDEYISHWESSPDTGVYDAWNKVLPRAIGEWVLFLGADDSLFDNSIISNTFTILKEIDSSIDIAYGRVRLVSEGNEKIAELGKNWNQTKRCIVEKMCIPHQGIFHRRSLFNKYGDFCTDYYISSDYEFLKRVGLERNVFYLDLIVSCMRVGGISSDPKYTFTRLNEIRHINKNYGEKFPGPLWLITFSNTCIRHALYFLIGEKSTKYFLDRFRMLVGLPSFWTKF
jgi:glycosyltransferase involved in cell wall biosynthesis